MENTKKGKGIIIAVIVAIVVVIVAVVAIFMFTKSSNKDDKKEETTLKTTSYHGKQIEEFEKACESEESMEKFVKESVNLKAFYAMRESNGPEDFEEEYKNAKSDDYENEEFVKEIAEAFGDYTETKIKVKDMGELKDLEEDDGLIGSTLSEIKGVKIAKFNMEFDDIEIGAYAYFYDGKILMILPDLVSRDNDYPENN